MSKIKKVYCNHELDSQLQCVKCFKVFRTVYPTKGKKKYAAYYPAVEVKRLSYPK
jgi:hypothetical protein